MIHISLDCSYHFQKCSGFPYRKQVFSSLLLQLLQVGGLSLGTGLLHVLYNTKYLATKSTIGYLLVSSVSFLKRIQRSYLTAELFTYIRIIEAKLFTRYSLLFTRYSLLFTGYSLLFTPYSILFTSYSLLVTFYLLLVTFYSLLFTFYSLIQI